MKTQAAQELADGVRQPWHCTCGRYLGRSAYGIRCAECKRREGDAATLVRYRQWLKDGQPGRFVFGGTRG